MHDAKLGDIYIDRSGKLWRVRGRCDEPMVFLEEIEPAEQSTKREMAGGVGDLMWDGFKRIHRIACRHEITPGSGHKLPEGGFGGVCKLCGEKVTTND